MKPKLTVIIPVYNEAGTIGELLGRVKAVKIPKEVIVVDDGSTDGTREYLEKIRDSSFRMVFNDENAGKGRCVREGIQAAEGEYVIIQDGDLEYNPQEYGRLLKTAEEKKSPVVFGSRILGRNKTAYISFYLGGIFLSTLVSVLYNQKITDVSTCYKLVKTDLIKSIRLECNGFDLDYEIASKILRRGIKIVEAPISYEPRSISMGKKVRWTDGVKGAYVIIKIRLKPKT